MKVKQASGWSVTLAFAVLLFLLVLVSLNTGKMSLRLGEIMEVFLGAASERNETIVYQFRMPRIVLAALVGFGMGGAGVVLQTLLRNDMASPGTLGISAGAGLFVMLVIAGFQITALPSRYLLPVLAFVGGITSAVLIFLLAYRRHAEVSPTGLILTGVAVGTGYGALTLMITLKLDDNQMEFAQRWNAGSLWGDDWNYIGIMLPLVAGIWLYLYSRYRILDLFTLGQLLAKGLGVRIRYQFVSLALAAVALSSVSVAFGGSFFFVGLIAPHIARRLCGGNHAWLLPASSLAGALLVLAADTLVRSSIAIVGIPTGIVITLISAPYFLYLLARIK